MNDSVTLIIWVEVWVTSVGWLQRNCDEDATMCCECCMEEVMKERYINGKIGCTLCKRLYDSVYLNSCIVIDNFICKFCWFIIFNFFFVAFFTLLE